jgi:predicted dithiol-disulfide oxidoreductase (DUF899 family)/predicted enzyme related to lactoylglutathione lyase
MTAITVLGALAVRDMTTARRWYEQLLAKPPDDVPMKEAAEWMITGSGSIQLVVAPDRAGRGLLTIGVDDIEGQLAAIERAGIAIDRKSLDSNAFRTVTIHDPDGNAITFAQDVRNRQQGEGLHMPHESAEYRTARDALLREEIELRRHLERVAAQRRALPPGGKAIDYEFVGEDGPVRLSQMFAAGKDSLITYAWMFGPERDTSCSSCAGFLDGLDGAAPHVMFRANLAVIARGPIERLVSFKRARGWRHLRVYSSGENGFHRDYGGRTAEGNDNPMINVFHRDGDGIRHTWGSELFYAQSDSGQHPRHNGTLDLLWNVLDLTPEGRGGDWGPKLEYP